MTGVQVIGGIFLAQGVWWAVLTLRDFREGRASWRTNWGKAITETYQSNDPTGFWLLTVFNAGIVAVSAWIGTYLAVTK